MLGMIDYNVNINGLDINAGYNEQDVQELFVPLLKQLTDLQKKLGRRILVMLSAPPGAGKSTLLSFLEKLSKETDGVGELQAIGMDGFHRRQEYLTSHETVRDGKTIKMVEIKGAPETFDIELLTERIKKVAAGENCGWPIYDRTLHNPVDNVITISKDIILLEGNYLLLDEDGWRELQDYADFTISVVADEQMLRQRLVTRKAQSCHDLEAAKKFVDYSDMANVKVCLGKTMQADLVLKVEETVAGGCRYSRIK